MASPGVKGPSWRRRAGSADSSDALHDVAGRTISPPPASGRQSMEEGRHLSSTPHREPIRSFVPGLTRDNLGTCTRGRLASTAAAFLLTYPPSSDRQWAIRPERSRGHGRTCFLSPKRGSTPEEPNILDSATISLACCRCRRRIF